MTKQSHIAFATLRGHLIAGEERFRVRKEANNDVFFDMDSFSKGAGLGVVAMPFIRQIQRQFFVDQSLAMRRLMASSVNGNV